MMKSQTTSYYSSTQIRKIRDIGIANTNNIFVQNASWNGYVAIPLHSLSFAQVSKQNTFEFKKE